MGMTNDEHSTSGGLCYCFYFFWYVSHWRKKYEIKRILDQRWNKINSVHKLCLPICWRNTHIQMHEFRWVQPWQNEMSICPSWLAVSTCCFDWDKLKLDTEGWYLFLHHLMHPPWHSAKYPQAAAPAGPEEGSWRSVCLEAGHLLGRWCSSGRSGIWLDNCGPESGLANQ